MPPFPSQGVTELGKAVLECRIEHSEKGERKGGKKYTMLPSEARLLTDVSGLLTCVYLSEKTEASR